MLVAIKFRAGRHVGEERMSIRTNCVQTAVARARQRFVAADAADAAKLGTSASKVLDVRVLDEAARRAEHGLPEPPEYLVLVTSRCPDDNEEHVDEIVVRAPLRGGALVAARYEWRQTVGRQFPAYRICGATIATPRLIDRLG